MRTEIAPYRQARICNCGNHGFVGLTRGFVAFVDPEHVSLIGNDHWRTTMRKGVVYASRTPPRYRDPELMHRLIMGVRPGQLIDHTDSNGLNNRTENLRICTAKENLRNRRMHRGKDIPFKGTYRDSSGYYARIMVSGKAHHLGRFRTPEEAAAAYDAAAINLHGAFARTNAALGLLPGGPQ